MLRLTQRGRLPGAVTLIMRRGVLAAFNAIGLQDPATSAPMRRHSVFRIYSMTKPIVSVAAMMLVEQGRLSLGDPVAAYLPEFAKTLVQSHVNGRVQHVAPIRPMTVHDLLRHTAGLTYEFLPPTPVRQLYAEAGLASLKRSNAEHSEAIARLPLMHQPGSVWDYSRATDVLGRLLEVVVNDSLGDHLRRSLLEPLGMHDTDFQVPTDQHDRIAEPFATDPDSGEAVRLIDVRRSAALESAGVGLASTAADYARFLQMLLQGGQLGSIRLLGRKTVAFMTADHLGAIPTICDSLPPGHGFGLGFSVRLATGGSAVPGSAGTYGWGGIGGTAFFVDPQEELLALLMIQAPGQYEQIQQMFRNMVYAALDD